MEFALYATTGLSDHRLAMGDREIRHELVMITDDLSVDVGHGVASLLFDICELILESHQALLQGQVLGPFAPLVPGASSMGVMTRIPNVLPESFAMIDSIEPLVIIPWLVPLTVRELDHVHSNGWRALDEVMDQRVDEIFDFSRESLI